jgi:hypothetical protein
MQMSVQQTNQNDANSNNQNESNTVKDPDEWKTGDEEMTGAQRSYPASNPIADKPISARH